MTKKIIAQCIVCILSASTGLHAATIDWNSAGTDGDWNTSASWTGDVVPGVSDLARIKQAADVTVSASASANKLVTGDDSTITISSAGSLTVETDVEVGNSGGVAYGTMFVDGGTLTVKNKLSLALFGDDRTGTITFNSGNITVGVDLLSPVSDEDPTLVYNQRAVQIGGSNSGTGEVTMAGGTFKAYGKFNLGITGPGTLNLSGGTIDLTEGEWQNLEVGKNGAGTVNMTGGIIETKGLLMGKNGVTGNSNFYLDGGTLIVYGDAITLKSDSKLLIGDGVFQWQRDQWNDRINPINGFITNENITYGSPTTSGNYPDVTAEQSWTSASGAVTIYADTDEVRSGYTTVWAESNDTDGDGYNNSVDVFPNDVNEWADADGDNVGDNADVHDGYNDTELDAYLLANNYTSDGLNEQDLIDLRVGSKLASIANDQATLQVVIEQSNDLGSWSTLQTESVTVDAPAGTTKQFFRYRMQD